jgi:type 1 glutamine amidotransferase
MSLPLDALLVCGGRYHDMDFARLRLLEHLERDDRIRTRVREDYEDTDALSATDLLVTYTCDVRPSEPAQRALRDWVEKGGRWLALHGTNALLDHVPGKPFHCPDSHPLLMETLGSRFLAHPPIAPYTVTVSAPDHPLVAGIEPFETEDELYLCEMVEGAGGIEPLLETRYTGKALGFEADDWPDDDPRLVMYLHPVGEGSVLYLTLGHCRGKWDMRPLMDEYPVVERGAWELPVYHELLARGIRWASEARAEG